MKTIKLRWISISTKFNTNCHEKDSFKKGLAMQSKIFLDFFEGGKKESKKGDIKLKISKETIDLTKILTN
jgi:hypothetical protein